MAAARAMRDRLTAAKHGSVVSLAPVERRQTGLAGRHEPMHLAPARSFNIIPAGADHGGCRGQEKECVYFALTMGKLQAMADSHFDIGRVELQADNCIQTESVALATGYSSLRHLITAFGRVIGKPPGEFWREQIRSMT